MNNKRSYFKWLLASATVGLFLANCTVKNSSDESCSKGDKKSGCECPGGLTGHQVCDADGVFGECVCPADNSGAGTSNSTAGKSSSTAGTDGNEGGAPSTSGGTKGYTAGTSSGGVAAAVGGAGAGAGGEGGAPLTFDPLDCEDCLGKLCADELATCLDDVTCSDQYAAVIGCIDDQRGVDDGTTIVKRDVVRACGVTVGSSSTVDGFPDWAPIEMDPKTTDLLNCMATSSTDPQGPNPDWANDTNNFPASGPTAWPADSCAKLSCTSKF